MRNRLLISSVAAAFLLITVVLRSGATPGELSPPSIASVTPLPSDYTEPDLWLQPTEPHDAISARVPQDALVVADSRDSSQPWLGSMTRLVDSNTLLDLPEFHPMNPVNCRPVSPRPDGRVLAVPVGWVGPSTHTVPPSCDTYGLELRLFDLERWDWVQRLGGRMYNISALTWSADGGHLYAVGDGGLMIFDATGHSEPRLVPLPAGTIWRWVVAPDDSALYILVYDRDPEERAVLAKGLAFLVVLDLMTGMERARIILPGLKIGYRHDVEEDVSKGYPLYEPGMVMAPDGSRMYVAYPDKPVIDVINLREHRVERTVRTDRQAGIIERLLDIFAQTAEAKGGPQFSKQLTVSPDGRWLYVTGWSSSFEPAEDSGGYWEVYQPVGVTAVDTKTWQVQQMDARAYKMTLSPDGAWLYLEEPPLTNRAGVSEGEHKRYWAGSGLRVLEAASGRQMAVLAEGKNPLQITLQGNDRLYLTVPGPDFGTAPEFLTDNQRQQWYRQERKMADLMSFEVGSWRQLALRHGHLNLSVVAMLSR